MQSFVILALFCLVGWSSSQKCPARFYKFTPQHSYCLPPRSRQFCQISRTGVSQQDKDLILSLHNQFRSKTAMGNENRARDGSLPQAADMIQMEWDNELAAVAQKWTQNCQWGHDCNECRAVENFAVGQNLAMQNRSCSGHGCQKPNGEPDWTWAITALYNEIEDYYVSWLDSHYEHTGPQTGHLTQIIWSRSWRVGCGYSFYKEGGKYHQYYACNYGPAGNTEGEPVYKQGRPCSACPTNTQCSVSRRKPNTYPGLCKMINPNTAPEYPRDQNGQLFYCGASSRDPDCQAKVSGDGTWETVHSLGGNYESIVLRGGQSTAITFNTPVKPHGDRFCIVLNFRKGPLDALRRDASSFKTDFKMDNSFSPPIELKLQTTSFTRYSLDIPWDMKTKLGFTFSVPRGAGKHNLDIRTIAAYDGSCSSRKG